MARNRERSAWGTIMTLGTAAAVAVGIGAAMMERAGEASDEAYVEARVKDECRRVTYDTDRIVCETAVRREVFGREQ